MAPIWACAAILASACSSKEEQPTASPTFDAVAADTSTTSTEPSLIAPALGTQIDLGGTPGTALLASDREIHILPGDSQVLRYPATVTVAGNSSVLMASPDARFLFAHLAQPVVPPVRAQLRISSPQGTSESWFLLEDIGQPVGSTHFDPPTTGTLGENVSALRQLTLRADLGRALALSEAVTSRSLERAERLSSASRQTVVPLLAEIRVIPDLYRHAQTDASIDPAILAGRIHTAYARLDSILKKDGIVDTPIQSSETAVTTASAAPPETRQ